MNRPYITVEAILGQFRSTADEHPGPLAPGDSLLWLAEFLARERATMDAGDWDALVHVGALLWRAHATYEAWGGTPEMR